jgi:NAD(P)-dependent dehydrogenase (short-subunit alcohol dehydrogenase family)
MELNGARVLVVGSTGVLGRLLTEALAEAGARLAVTGRDQERLADVAEHAEVSFELDVLDVTACRDVVRQAAEGLGGLDVLIVATGVAGFGQATETPDAVTEELFAVNTLGPIALCAEAVPLLSSGGVVAVLSAILADAPMAGMAAYSASKAALSGYLAALRREVRRQGLIVLDTGLADRAIAGEPPKLPAGHDPAELVRALLEGVRNGSRELVYDPKSKSLALV